MYFSPVFCDILRKFFAAFKTARDDSALLYKLEGNTLWRRVVQWAHIVLEIYERNVILSFVFKMEYYDDCGKFHIGVSLLFVEAKSWSLQFFLHHMVAYVWPP